LHCKNVIPDKQTLKPNILFNKCYTR